MQPNLNTTINPTIAPMPALNGTPAINQTTPGMLADTAVGTAGNIADTAVGTAGHVAPTSMLQQDPLGTVQGRTASIIDQNSPLMRRAAAKALIQANSRGMLNSSMAIGSAQNAVLQAAAPIAANDAASYNDFAKTNQAAMNAVNTANAGLDQQANLAAAAAQNATATKNASMTQQANLTNAQEINKTSQMNVTAQNNIVMANLDQANKVSVIDITAKYKNQMQSNITSANLYTTTMNAISKMQADTNMTPETRRNNIDHALALLRSGLTTAGSIANLNLTSTLDFTGVNP